MNNEEQFLLNRSELQGIVKIVIEEARTSWGWGESMDIEVMWLKIDRVIEPNRTLI